MLETRRSETPHPLVRASPAGEWTFRAEDVVKVYSNGVRANDGISLHVEPGEVYGLLGPNGAARPRS